MDRCGQAEIPTDGCCPHVVGIIACLGGSKTEVHMSLEGTDVRVSPIGVFIPEDRTIFRTVLASSRVCIGPCHKENGHLPPVGAQDRERGRNRHRWMHSEWWVVLASPTSRYSRRAVPGQGRNLFAPRGWLTQTLLARGIIRRGLP